MLRRFPIKIVRELPTWYNIYKYVLHQNGKHIIKIGIGTVSVVTKGHLDKNWFVLLVLLQYRRGLGPRQTIFGNLYEKNLRRLKTLVSWEAPGRNRRNHTQYIADIVYDSFEIIVGLKTNEQRVLHYSLHKIFRRIMHIDWFMHSYLFKVSVQQDSRQKTRFIALHSLPSLSKWGPQARVQWK